MFDPKDVATASALLVLLMGLVCLYYWGYARELKRKLKKLREKHEEQGRHYRWLAGRLHSREQEPRPILVITQRVPYERATEPPSVAAPKRLDNPSNGHARTGPVLPGGQASTVAHTVPPISEVPKRADRC